MIAVGVAVKAGGATQPVFGKRITLSAGAVASPGIRMRSGVGPRRELERHGIRAQFDAPGVGRNLMEYPLIMMLTELSGDAVRRSEDQPRPLQRPSALHGESLYCSADAQCDGA